MTRHRPKIDPPLFHREYGGWRLTPPPAPPRQQSSTRRAAAESMRAIVPPIRRRILAWVAERRATGATAEEAQTVLALRPATAAARFSELAQAGLIMDSKRTRPTTSGRQAVVWIISGSGADNG